MTYIVFELIKLDFMNSYEISDSTLVETKRRKNVALTLLTLYFLRAPVYRLSSSYAYTLLRELNVSEHITVPFYRNTTCTSSRVP